MPRRGRRWDYDRRLLPNSYLARFEPQQPSPEMERLRAVVPTDEAGQKALQAARYDALLEWLGGTEMTMGYPAWNLLYYSMISSLLPTLPDPVVIETGTNLGLSTIVMAQALKDVGLQAVVETVEHNPERAAEARRNVEAAGLGEYVTFHVGDAIEFLSSLIERVEHLDFVFLDDLHERYHVEREIDLVCPKVAVRRGKVYFDNTGGGGVAAALGHLRDKHGGNLVEFANCSWHPAGNAIWQPD
jgi:predicted O-methyltransferase YrrM